MEYYKTLDGKTFYKVSDTIGLEVRITEGWERVSVLTKESCQWVKNDCATNSMNERIFTMILPEDFNEAHDKVKVIINKILIL